MKWKIGNVNIDNQIVLAPMAGVCDSAFRTIIKEMGCGLVGTEMLSNKAVIHGSDKTRDMIYMTDFERPISQQIFGPDKESFIISSEYVYDNMHPDIIDLNMGCPVNKVAKRGESGSALLKDPEKISEIVSAVVDTVPIPVTVKIRSGWDCSNINAVEVAHIIEDAGASAVAVHPRTRTQSYEIHSDWSIIQEVKDTVNIPVIGNGDIKTCYDARRMLDETCCDAVMIGRGVIGNPWLIRDCVNYLDYNIEPDEVSLEDKYLMIKKHASLLFKNYKKSIAFSKLKKHSADYMKNLPGNSRIKQAIFQTKNETELFNLIREYLSNLC